MRLSSVWPCGQNPAESPRCSRRAMACETWSLDAITVFALAHRGAVSALFRSLLVVGCARIELLSGRSPAWSTRHQSGRRTASSGCFNAQPRARTRRAALDPIRAGSTDDRASSCARATAASRRRSCRGATRGRRRGARPVIERPCRDVRHSRARGPRSSCATGGTWASALTSSRPSSQARRSNRFERVALVRPGQMEQLKRSANASAATTLDRTLAEIAELVRSVTF